MDKHLWDAWRSATTTERGDILVGVSAMLIFVLIIFDLVNRFAV